MRQAVFKSLKPSLDQHLILDQKLGWQYPDPDIQELFELLIPYPPRADEQYTIDPFGDFVNSITQDQDRIQLLTIDPAPPRPEYDANGQHILY